MLFETSLMIAVLAGIAHPEYIVGQYAQLAMRLENKQEKICFVEGELFRIEEVPGDEPGAVCTILITNNQTDSFTLDMQSDWVEDDSYYFKVGETATIAVDFEADYDNVNGTIAWKKGQNFIVTQVHDPSNDSNECAIAIGVKLGEDPQQVQFHIQGQYVVPGGLVSISTESNVLHTHPTIPKCPVSRPLIKENPIARNVKANVSVPQSDIVPQSNNVSSQIDDTTTNPDMTTTNIDSGVVSESSSSMTIVLLLLSLYHVML